MDSAPSSQTVIGKIHIILLPCFMAALLGDTAVFG